MKRALMQAYVTGSIQAVERYKKAFAAVIVSSYLNENGSYYHCELDIEGEILAVAERQESAVCGNVMQFCLHYGEGNEAKIRRAYETLQDDAQILVPLAPCDFSPLMTDFIDAYGVRWCLFI